MHGKVNMDNLHKIVEWIPFLMVTSQGDKRYHLNYSDIAKTIIIGVLTGLLSAYITVQKIELRLGEVEKKLDRIQYDFYRPRVQEDAK